MRFPATCPAWVSASLDVLGLQGRLSGVAPEVMAAICKFTSGYAAAIPNSAGYGGYFGIGAALTYSGRSMTAAQLETPATFGAQATLAASVLAGYGLALGAALDRYSGGAALAAYVATATGADLAGPVTQTGDITSKGAQMGVSITDTMIAVTGVSDGHKFVFTCPITERTQASAWSVMDLTDVANAQNVADANAFTS